MVDAVQNEDAVLQHAEAWSVFYKIKPKVVLINMSYICHTLILH